MTYSSNTISEFKQSVIDYQNDQMNCLQAFLLKVKDELSVSCSLPLQIPDKNLMSIIDRSKEWFYKHYEHSLEEGYLYVDQSLYESNQFKTDRSILLPLDIYSVYGVHKVNGGAWRTSLQDLGKYSNAYVSYGTESSFEDLMGYVAAEKYASLRNDILVNSSVSHSFNYLTHKFRISGQIPSCSIVLEVYKKIPDCALFSEEIFLRYVIAQSMKNLSRVLGMFTYNLPGNVTINYDTLSSLGSEELDKIETEIRESEPIDWFLMG